MEESTLLSWLMEEVILEEGVVTMEGGISEEEEGTMEGDILEEEEV